MTTTNAHPNTSKTESRKNQLLTTTTTAALTTTTTTTTTTPTLSPLRAQKEDGKGIYHVFTCGASAPRRILVKAPSASVVVRFLLLSKASKWGW